MSLITTDAQKAAMEKYFKTNGWSVVSPTLIGGTVFAEDQSSPFLLKGSSPGELADILYIILNKHGYTDPSIDVINISDTKTTLLQHAEQCKAVDPGMWGLIINDLAACI